MNLIDSETKRTGFFWTPAGFEERPLPTEIDYDDFYEVVFDIMMDAGSSRGRVSCNGYMRVVHQPESDWITITGFSVFEFGTRSNSNHHLLVALGDNGDSSWADFFFVAKEHKSAFYLDKMPRLLQTTTNEDAMRAAQALSKAMIAYVRHGIGKNTITEDGTESQDDIARRHRKMSGKD